MTIKKIKEKYQKYRCSGNEKNSFVVYDWGYDKVVIVVNISSNKLIGKYVTQVIRVADGKELLEQGSCRPCDNLEDAIDVAGEMIPNDLFM